MRAWEKNSTWDWRRDEEKLNEGLSQLTTWNCSILVFELSQKHWQTSTNFSVSSADFQASISGQIETLPDRVRKTFESLPLLQVVNRRNFAKFLANSQVDFFLAHGPENFYKKLEIKGFSCPCHI